MTGTDLLASIFLDYDNLLPVQRASGVLDIVTKVLIQLPWQTNVSRGRCDIRVYGGWFEGEQLTRVAQDLAVELQRDFPTILRLPRKTDLLALSASAHLAMSLLQEPGRHLFHTYRRKGKPNNIRVAKPDDVGCTDAACFLPLAKHILKKGTCPKQGCTATGCDLIYRHEQKIVDTMLTCDLIHAADHKQDRIILISGDDDFVPPLRTVLLRGGTAVRCYPQPNPQRIAFPPGTPQLLELDI